MLADCGMWPEGAVSVPIGHSSRCNDYYGGYHSNGTYRFQCPIGHSSRCNMRRVFLPGKPGTPTFQCPIGHSSRCNLTTISWKDQFLAGAPAFQCPIGHSSRCNQGSVLLLHEPGKQVMFQCPIGHSSRCNGQNRLVVVWSRPSFSALSGIHWVATRYCPGLFLIS